MSGAAPAEFTKFETGGKEFDNKASMAALHQKEGKIAQEAAKGPQTTKPTF